MALAQIAGPAQEPLTADDVKNFLRVDTDLGSVDDALIAGIITTARQYAETLTGRSLITQTWRLRLDCFPPLIELERGTVQSVEAIQYTNLAGGTSTADLSLVARDFDSLPARLTPTFGNVWPTDVAPQIGAVWVNYTAGYGLNPSNVPAGILQWMRVRIATLYQHREEVEVMSRGKLEPLPYVDRMLDPFIAYTL